MRLMDSICIFVAKLLNDLLDLVELLSRSKLPDNPLKTVKLVSSC
jgi:hypothetical protein